MAKNVPVLLLKLVERWLSLASTCVECGGHITHFFKVIAGVRWRCAVSMFIYNISVHKIKRSCLGCNLSFLCTSILLYADDSLLLSPSVHGLQAVLICEQELFSLHLCLNHNKSVCIRVGPCFNVDCVKIATCNGHELEWVNECRYIGILCTIVIHVCWELHQVSDISMARNVWHKVSRWISNWSRFLNRLRTLRRSKDKFEYTQVVCKVREWVCGRFLRIWRLTN